LHFEVATGCEGIEGFADHGCRAYETAEQGAAMDEVEFLAKYPVVLGVLDFKPTVWRNTLGSEYS
jgi:hypothetical protein